ncbi:helix-turn-helix domain-containing protein [Pseudomonas sp. R-28-1W-6]|uniref:winged helix-turn-helix transcriptional regulator n=1 Tax=Pseudomonas sp. R-28-1W-6 TaxID=2650101 RepID=UPI002113EAC5|nr:helix-turn-helix domain-containing protein [Pseudomonas sp. R-28-1W-6]
MKAVNGFLMRARRARPDLGTSAMERVTFEDRNCSVARSVDILGDWWNLLIIRELLWGASKFDEFQRNLEISTGILSRRLKLLQQHGVIAKSQGASGVEYKLTEKGRALHVIIIAILQWGDNWNPLPNGSPVQPINKKTGASISPVRLTDSDGRSVELSDLGLLPGPGADNAIKQRLGALIQASKQQQRETQS